MIDQKKLELLEIQVNQQRDITALMSMLKTVELLKSLPPAVGALEQCGRDMNEFAKKISRDAMTEKILKADNVNEIPTKPIEPVSEPQAKLIKQRSPGILLPDEFPDTDFNSVATGDFEPPLPSAMPKSVAEAIVADLVKYDAYHEDGDEDTLAEAVVKCEEERQLSTLELPPDVPIDLSYGATHTIVAGPKKQPSVIVTKQKWDNPTLPIEQRAEEYLKSNGKSAAMKIGTALRMPTPSHMKLILENDPRFVRDAANFWNLKESGKKD